MSRKDNYYEKHRKASLKETLDLMLKDMSGAGAACCQIQELTSKRQAALKAGIKALELLETIRNLENCPFPASIDELLKQPF